MDGVHMHDPRKLFYVEVIDEDGDRYVNWEWAMNEQEILSRDTDDMFLVEVREATSSETSAWNDGNEEGVGLSMANERLANWNGVAFKLTSFDPMTTEQVFTCGICQEFLSFDKVATISNFYLSVVNNQKEQENHVLWHVCIECSKA